MQPINQPNHTLCAHVEMVTCRSVYAQGSHAIFLVRHAGAFRNSTDVECDAKYYINKSMIHVKLALSMTYNMMPSTLMRRGKVVP